MIIPANGLLRLGQRQHSEFSRKLAVWLITLGQLMVHPVLLAFHIVFALAAVLLGAVVLLMKKGTPRHRLLGRCWGASMLVVAATSFAFPPRHLMMVEGISYLHILSVATVTLLPLAVWAIRHRKVALHYRLMGLLYGLLCLTGVAAMFMPGRFLHQLFFA